MMGLLITLPNQRIKGYADSTADLQRKKAGML